jgi:hypothetical protein
MPFTRASVHVFVARTASGNLSRKRGSTKAYTASTVLDCEAGGGAAAELARVLALCSPCAAGTMTTSRDEK